jgi:type II secretory pathway pseudopilin PulG
MRGRSPTRGNESAGAGAAPRAAAAFTLIEMVLSMGILSLVLGAAMAVVTLAARSAPDPRDSFAEQIAMQSVADQIALDAGDASEVELVGKHEVRLVCDDMTGDDAPDTIVYAWTGVVGDPLVRSFNGVSRVVIEEIQGLAFTAQGVLLSTQGASQAATRTNQSVAGVPLVGSGGASYTVRSNALGQRFKARVPSDATSWTLTGVALWLERDGLSDSQGAVQIWSDDNGEPGSMLAQRTFLEGSLSGTPTKETFALSLAGLDPDAAYWIVVRATLLNSPCGVLEAGESVASDHECLARWSSSSSKWTTSAESSLVYEVRGDVSMTQPASTVESRATALFVNLSTERTKATSGVRLAHRPLLVVDDDAVVDVVATQDLLDSVAETLDSVVDATGGLLGGLLGGGGK